MFDLQATLVVLGGIAVRLIIPIGVTAAAVYFLQRLDANWQREAHTTPMKVEKPACWETMGCAAAQRSTCPGYTSSLPCWQARRTASGYMREQCLECKVFLKAPIPQPHAA